MAAVLRAPIARGLPPQCLGLAAIAGKQACGLGGLGSNLNRVAIGIGMIPRGGVGIILAGMGLTLVVDGLLRDPDYGMVTTLVIPSLLQWSFARRR